MVLSFHIPGFQHAIARGVVRYRIAAKNQTLETFYYKYGIEFENIDFDSKRHIRYYVASDRQSIKKPAPTGTGF
ncbi:MAG: hypothetical protein R2827_04305 [Bdellovibrionales bacterium]